VEELAPAQAVVEVVLHLADHGVELLLEVAEEDLRIPPEELVVELPLERLEAIGPLQPGESVLAAGREPAAGGDLLDPEVAADGQVDDGGRDVPEVDALVDEGPDLGWPEALGRLVVYHDRPGPRQVPAAEEPRRQADRQGRGE